MYLGELLVKDIQSCKYSDGHAKGASRFESALLEAIDQYVAFGRFEEITKNPDALKKFIDGQYANFADYCEVFGMNSENR